MRPESQFLATQLLQEISIRISSGSSESKSTLIWLMGWVKPGDPAYNPFMAHLPEEKEVTSGIFMKDDF